MEEVAWKLNCRGEGLSGQIGVRKGGEGSVLGIQEGTELIKHVWETTDKSELLILALIAK